MSTPQIEIREEAYETFIAEARAVADYAFGASPVERDVAKALSNAHYYADSRAFVAYDGDTPQATVVVHAMTQNVRGVVVPMGGVAAVASMPAARRRGWVRQLMAEAFRQQREAGQAVSTLYPFRESFYQRMGYAGFHQPRYLKVKPDALAPITRLALPGSWEQVTMRDGYDTWRAWLETYQRGSHGFSLRAPSSHVRWRDDNDRWVAFARHDGEIVGVMTFRITGYTERLEATHFLTTSPVGVFQLLDLIARHTDQVAEVSIALPADAHPETWLPDLNASVSSDNAGAPFTWPTPMGRVIDVAGLAGIGAGDGTVTLEISDDACPWNTGTFTLIGDGGTLRVTPGGEPSGGITIQGLSALVFTGIDPAMLLFRGWGEVDAEAHATVRSLFPAAVPTLHEQF